MRELDHIDACSKDAFVHGGTDQTPKGFKVTGWPITTMVRGKFVLPDGKLVGADDDGRYISREKSRLPRRSGACPKDRQGRSV